MRPADEIQQVNDRLVFWQGYDPSAKVDLASHAYLTPEGWVLVDPIPLRDGVLEELGGRGKIEAIFLTSANHERAAADFKIKRERVFLRTPGRGARFPWNPTNGLKEGMRFAL